MFPKTWCNKSRRGLLNDSKAGVLMGNAGNRFPDQVRAAHRHYTVIAGNGPNVVFTVESHPAPLVRKVLSAVRFEDAPATTDDSR